jgi:hypothetical protein
LLALLLQFAFPVLAGNNTITSGDAVHHILISKHDVKPVALGLFEKTENEEENKDEDFAANNNLSFFLKCFAQFAETPTLSYTSKSAHLIEWPVYLKILVFRI